MGTIKYALSCSEPTSDTAHCNTNSIVHEKQLLKQLLTGWVELHCSTSLQISLMSSLMRNSWVSELLLHSICYHALFCLKDMEKCSLTQTHESLAFLGRLFPGAPHPTPPHAHSYLACSNPLCKKAQPVHIPSRYVTSPLDYYNAWHNVNTVQIVCLFNYLGNNGQEDPLYIFGIYVMCFTYFHSAWLKLWLWIPQERRVGSLSYWKLQVLSFSMSLQPVPSSISHLRSTSSHF